MPLRFGAACILVALAGVLVVESGCGSDSKVGGVAIDRSFQTMIWPNATVLAGSDIERLKKTDFYRKYSSQLDFPGLTDASERLGFDPRRDVRSLLLESDGRRTLLLAKGALSASAIRGKLSAMGAKATPYRSFQLLGDKNNSLVLLGGSEAIGGSADAVRSALDLREGKSGSIAPDLQTRLQAIPSGTEIWIVSSKGLPFAEMEMRSDVRSLLSNIVTFISGTTAGLQVDDGARLNLTIACISPAGAKRVHDAIRGGIGLARLTTKDDQTDLLKAFDAINVDQAESVVNVKAALNADEVDKLMALIPQTRRLAQTH